MKTSNVQRPTSNIERWLAALLVGAVLLIGFNTGCQTTSQPPTTEAIKFYSFKDTWTATHSAYQTYAELVVLGKVSAADEADIDAAWNSFRAGFKAALLASNQNWNAATPASIEKLKDDFITIIRSLP